MPRGGARRGAGRPKGKLNVESARLRELCRSHTEAVVAALAEIANDPESSQRVAAGAELLNRAYGRPRKEIDADISDVMAKLRDKTLTALDAGLEIESRGSRLPDSVKLLILQEIGMERVEIVPVNESVLLAKYEYGMTAMQAEEKQLVGRGPKIEAEILNQRSNEVKP